MSKTLKLDKLKGFKAKGVNVDKSIIDNALKEFNAKKGLVVEKLVVPPKNKHLKVEFKKPSSASVDAENVKILQVIKDEYEQKIALLEKKVKIAESKDKALSKNEDKLLSAIKSERINQSVEEPIVGRAMLIKKYKMNSKYLDDSIKGLEERKVIERKQVPYSTKIMTNSWKLL